MKKIFALIAIALITLTAYAQGDNIGMNFEHAPSWKDILAKAKQDNKFVFLDCYTTWCGPCKQMSANVFTKKEVGDFYNANFVNAKVQLDTTENDNDYIKSWYKDAAAIATTYNVKAYPTYLIFNRDGDLVHRFVGSMPPEEFVKKGQELLNPDNQYYTQLKKFDAGDKSPELLLRLVKLAQASYDNIMVQKLVPAYLATQKDLYTKDNLELLYNTTKTTKDRGFKIAAEEGEKADKILGTPGKSRNLAEGIILQEEYRALLSKGNKPDFVAYDKLLQTKYPSLANRVSSFTKAVYYSNNGDWASFAKYIDEYVRYNKNIGAERLNNFAWSVFENVKDKAVLQKAANWSKLSLQKNDLAMYIDTHANLLYKLGNVKEAIAEEKRAVASALKTGENVKGYEEVVAKMEKGEPTWPQ